MKEVMVITDTLSAISPELAEECDVIAVPYHLIFDGKDYLDNTFDRGELFKRLESYQNLPTHSACTTGEILEAYKKASQRAKGILFVALSSTMSADYNAALQAKEVAKQELPDTAVEVVDSRTVICGELLVVLAAARAANEGKSLSEMAEIARRLAQQVIFITVPETLFFLERSGRGGVDHKIAKSPIPIYALMAMDASSGGTGKIIAKHRSKAKAIEALLEMVKEKSRGKKLHAAINYTDNPEEAEALKKKLLSQFEISEIHITPCSVVACVVYGPRCVSLGFYAED
jgi:DegV family protein with EDD domain